MSDQLSPYLLDSSLVNYTTSVVLESLHDVDNETKRKRASSALAFFENVLDPSKEVEKAQLDIFSKYREALSGEYAFLFRSSLLKHPASDANAAKAIIESHPAAPSIAHTHHAEYDLTPAQRVLTLPDTLDIIFSHITTLSKSTRDTLHAASLTSVSLHYAAQLRLWRRPRDLNTVQQQVRFAFGVAISTALGEGLGVHVKRLRIRVMKGAWNARLVTTIVELCPSVNDLTIHWGDSEDGTENVASESVEWLSKTLALVPNLAYLNLAQYSYAQVAADLSIPQDAHLPFSKLKELQLYGFHWYFDAIERGLGSNLTSLDIGYGTRLSATQVISAARKLTSLTSLRFAGPLELDQLRLFVETAPGLECIDVELFDERDQPYMAGVYTTISELPAIKKVSVSVPAGPTQITQLAKSSAPLEDLTFSVIDIEEESAVRAALLDLFTAKRATLKRISELSGFKLAVDDQLADAFAATPTLERLDLTFDPSRVVLSDAAVEKLLTQCPSLELTDGLNTLVSGRALYEEKYKTAFEKAQAAVEEELAEDVLAN